MASGRYVGADIGGIVWIGARDVDTGGKVFLRIEDEYPAVPHDHTPGWPLVSYVIHWTIKLGPSGYADITFFVDRFRFLGKRLLLRVLRWNGDGFVDVTLGADERRGTVTARSDRNGTFIVVTRAEAGEI